LAMDAETGERCDDPGFEMGDEAADVADAAVEVEHDIGNALAGAVIRVLAAAAGAEDGEALRVEEVARVGARPGGVERRVLHQPDELGRGAGADRLTRVSMAATASG